MSEDEIKEEARESIEKTENQKAEKMEGEDLTKYLLEKVKSLERDYLQMTNETIRVKKGYAQRLQYLEDKKRELEYANLQFERELLKLRSEIERLRTAPLMVGTLVDVVDDKRAIVRTTAGPSFLVSYSQLLDIKTLLPGVRVALNQQSFTILEVLLSEKDPAVSAMEIDEKPKITYADIGGLDEQINEIKEAVELPLLKPEMFKKVGIEPPKGVLLFGPPGTGKTMLAKAVANQTHSTFIKLIGSELVRKYIGEGARLVRELFKMASEKAPAIIFIDEIDAIGAKRSDVSTSGDREVQRTLMQLLAEMDGFNTKENIKIVGATNRVDIIDPAMLRPGRFDRLIEIPLPDIGSRASIFKIHLQSMSTTEDVDVKALSKSSENASGADVKAIATEAGMFAIREGRETVAQKDFEKAIEKVMKRKQEGGYSPEAAGVMYT